MSFNGSGTFVLPAGQPVVTATAIDSAVHNTLASDLATGLTNCLTRDGQSPPTANLPMGGFRHTGAGTATARTMLPLASQVQDDALIWGGTGGGTVDVITISTTPATTAHTTGAGFEFIASGANTGAVTLNPNSVGAKAVTKNGATALVAGDIQSGAIVRVKYDGTRYQLMNVTGGSGRLLAVTTFTASGTYTKAANLGFAIFRVVGSGGGGGGTNATGAAGAGGGGGAYSVRKVANASIGATETVTIGAAGTAGSGAGGNGGNGGTSSVGSLCTAAGGSGGAGSTVSTASRLGGTAGGAGTSDYTVDGNYGGNGIPGTTDALAAGGNGGASGFGGGGGVGRAAAAGTGVAGTGYGAGGGGSTGVSNTGGAGKIGFVIVEEYS